MFFKYFKKAVLIALLITSNAKAQPFFPVGSGVDQPIICLHADTITNILFAGGWFSQAGGLQSHCIATWNGANWDSTRNQMLYPPLDQVTDIEKFNNEIYITGSCGIYDTLGIFDSWCPSKWDSSANVWIDFGANPNYQVQSLYLYNNELYFLGLFDSIGGIYSSKIARYDGTNWYGYPPLDTSGGWGQIGAAMYYNGDLYVGGNYGISGFSPTEDLAMFDGTQWLPVGGGLSGAATGVGSFEIYQGKLIVGGTFQTAWGDPGNNIAAWDGTSWSQLGTGLIGSNGVWDLEVYNGELWACGNFVNAGGLPVSNLAKWDGTQWYSLGVTFDNTVASMAVLGNDLYIAGAFWTMNGDSVHRIIRYNYLTGFESLEPEENQIEIFPNPASSTLTIKNFNSVSLPAPSFTGSAVEVYNTLGEKLKSFSFSQLSCHPEPVEGVEVFIGDLPKGLYLIQLKNEFETIHSQKIILQ